MSDVDHATLRLAGRERLDGPARSGQGDAALVDAVRRGDDEAFARLYAAHRRPIYRYALQMCGAAAADDVVQETFLVLLRGERFDPGRGTLSGYLFGIARHHILKQLSAAQREAVIDSEVIEELASDETAALEGMSRDEAVQAVRAAIQSLPLVYREIVTLCELEELDYATAASVLQCPIGTVRSRLHRAKTLLSAKLTGTATVRSAALSGRDSQA